MKYELRFDCSKIGELAGRYTSAQKEKEQQIEVRIEHTIGPRTRKKGSYSKEDFLELCKWKSVRTQPRCAQNDDPQQQGIIRRADRVADLVGGHDSNFVNSDLRKFSKPVLLGGFHVKPEQIGVRANCRGQRADHHRRKLRNFTRRTQIVRMNDRINAIEDAPLLTP